MKQIVILNGPPGCGKDTIAAELLVKDSTVTAEMFKSGLYIDTAKNYNVPLEMAVELFTERELKEVPNPLFDGLSPRNALIHVSENIIKPQKGEDYYGKKLAEVSESCLNLFDTVIVTDGGFIGEIEAVADYFDFTDIKVKVVQLTRPDCSFEGDSRNYVESARSDITTYRVGLIKDNIEHALETLRVILEDE